MTNLPLSPFGKGENKTMVNNDIINMKKSNTVDYKVIDISNNKYIIDMEHELIKTQKNIENSKYNNNDKKTIEILKETLVQVFTNNRYMVNQLKQMNTITLNNEHDLKRALENIKQLNIICESIYV